MLLQEIFQSAEGTPFAFADGAKAYVKVVPKIPSATFAGTQCIVSTVDLHQSLLRPKTYIASTANVFDESTMKRIEWVMSNKLSHMIQTPKNMEFTDKLRFVFWEIARDFGQF